MSGSVHQHAHDIHLIHTKYLLNLSTDEKLEFTVKVSFLGGGRSNLYCAHKAKPFHDLHCNFAVEEGGMVQGEKEYGYTTPRLSN